MPALEPVVYFTIKLYMNKQGKKFKKVLIIIASYSAFRDPIEKAFKSLSIRTYHFDNRKTTLFEKFIFGLSIIYSPLYGFATSRINDRLLKQVEVVKPDLVLVSKGENITDTTVKKISRKTIIVNWFTDYLVNFKNIEKWLNAYNVFFTGDRSDVKSYRSKGYKNLYCLPYAGPSIAPGPKNRKYDLVFIGTYSETREKLFEKLAILNLKIWGDKNWKKSILRGCYMGKWLNFKEVVRVLKNSKIVINNHQNRVLNLRVYEATAAGALLITDYSDDLSLMYKIGSEVIVYKNKNDLFKKVEYYLKRDSQREKIASAGRSRHKKDHNYPRRVMQLLNLINSSSIMHSTKTTVPNI